MKNTNEQSLRCQVEKWLAPTMHVHVTRFGRTAGNGRRYVCVETSSPAAARALFFFRDDDGSWSVFPPTTNRRKSTAEHALAQVSAATTFR
ncbi:hypothetical protein [Paraburkholderia rhynchosiae]|uniref:Uncharacterized protein n=1 Tax=Paraburkholderia rhynchosiae TaxID=487049 RepID=A0A2N7WHX1_9BURK|nr:hypothetical protein [Paraburkholderia rhynchosiae]PMS29069.1 hypothetical protein C0Z16_20015 [Paraburkholderia rhynchosiae]CAB3652418.1 hypothetical protein LMG27174_01221 [Paraburkholderia rhynchosiae]